MNAREQILHHLDQLGVDYRLDEHAPAYTMADCAEVDARLGCLAPKNLFLAPRNQSAFYLCVVRPDAPFRTADVSRQIGSSRLSFGPEERLWEYLNVRPGAISPLGLIFDPEKRVQLLMDEALLDEPRLAFHPNDNAATLVLSGVDFFEKFLPSVGHPYTAVHLESAPVG